MRRTILLADDHKMFRDGLKVLFSKNPRFELVAEASTGTETLEKVNELKPDLVIMDVSMPEMNGIEATRRLLADHPETKVIILSMHADRRFVQETLKAGASGY
ncbi:response regulator, partial [bacterium]|nr:response regulator [bacterium]